MNQSSISCKDLLPDDHEYLTYIKKVIRHRCRQSGFRRISPTLFEDIDFYKKRLNMSEEVLKEKGVLIQDTNLQTEGIIRACPLASVARCYFENKMDELPQPVELYSLDVFLKRDNKGKIKECLNFGLHVLGVNDPALSAQVIYLANKILDDLGLKELYSLQINDIGSEESRKIYLEDLKNFYYDKQRSMTEESVRDYEKGNLIKLLQSEDEDMKILAQLAPKLENYLNAEDKKQYEQLKEYLDELGISYVENKSLFGEQHYNAHTVFEFWHNDKGSDKTLFCGGVNDNFISREENEEKNIIGFSIDCMKLMTDMKEAGIRVPHKDHLQVFVAQLGVNAKKKALFLLERLRESGIQAVGAMGTGSMRIQLDMASEFGVKYTLLLGEIEVKEGMVIVRDMKVGTQESVPFTKVVEIMQERIGKEKMDVMEDNEKSVDLK